MSYSNFGKQHGGRGLKAFVAVVCVLLVVAIVASALVLWRTTNHFTELPEFENSDEDFVGEVVDPDDPDVPDLDNDTSPSNDELPDFDLEMTSLSVPVTFAGSGSPLKTCTINVISSDDLSCYDSGWTIKSDESFYYDGMWHDVLGYEFAEDFVVSDYLSLSDESCESCTLNLLDYFPATCYVYFWISDGRNYSYGVCRVDCCCQVYSFSTYVYIGDSVPSFCSSGSRFTDGFNSFTFGLGNFYGYYDGWNFYNTLFYGDVDYLINSDFSFSGRAEEDYIIYRYQCPAYIFSTTSNGRSISFSSSVTSSNLCVSSPYFCEFGFSNSDSISFKDFVDHYSNPYGSYSVSNYQPYQIYFRAVSDIMNQLCFALVPYVSDWRVGSYLSDSFYEYFSSDLISYLFGSLYVTSSVLDSYDLNCSSSISGKPVFVAYPYVSVECSVPDYFLDGGSESTLFDLDSFAGLISSDFFLDCPLYTFMESVSFSDLVFEWFSSSVSFLDGVSFYCTFDDELGFHSNLFMG